MEHFSKALIVSYDTEIHGERREDRSSAMIIATKEMIKGEKGYFEYIDIINNYIADDADILYQILIGQKTLRQVITEYGGKCYEIPDSGGK